VERLSTDARTHRGVSLAYGVFARPGEEPRVGARRGERVLDLAALATAGRLGALPPRLFARAELNAFMAAGRDVWRECADRLGEIDEGGIALAEVELRLPIAVADYVDFFSSLEHATNAGRMFRPDAEPLPPNWRHLPIGYHGRAGTVVVSGTPVRRPSGQAKEPDAAAPVFGASRRLDIELELGFVIGAPSRLGEPVPVERATEHVFGAVLVNDWSARDIQAWESRPLGPFLGKSFATSIGAWVVPLDALEPYRVPAPPQQPEPLPYLREEPWAYDVELEVELQGEVVSRTSARNLYWSVAQQVAHLTVNGASLRTGDLLASGTVSGPEKRSRGSLLELSWNGSDPLELADGSTRKFLLDGDEVVLRGATPDGAVDLGEVRGRVMPA
jgi:fumarylacetoacetase